jgi:translation initiation factor 2A
LHTLLNQHQHLVTHLFCRTAGAQIMWNAPSTACLFMATCETDATNQSYYGESKLHYLPAEADRGDAACAVQMPKDGPVHDVQWSPAGDFFVVVAGFMPAKVG